MQYILVLTIASYVGNVNNIEHIIIWQMCTVIQPQVVMQLHCMPFQAYLGIIDSAFLPPPPPPQGS